MGFLGAAKGDQTQTDAFRRWFKDSAVCNEDDSPMVVWHASRVKGIDIFRESDDGELGPGIYFTGSKDYLDSYKDYLRQGPDDHVYVYACFVSIQRPLVLFGESAQQKYKAQTNGNSKNLKKVLMSLGFDGIMRFDYDGKELEQVVAFRPQQIKSATDNRGTFDPEDPNILHGYRRR